MKKRTKILISVLCVVVLLVGGGLGFAGNYFVNYALAADGEGGDRDAALGNESTPTDTGDQKPTDDTKLPSWATASQVKTLTITSDDGLKLKARWFQKNGSHKWVIAVHGYHSDMGAMEPYAQWYNEQGFQVLTPDLRAHGTSEGDYIGMGWLDRKDILLWIDTILKEDAQAQIVLHGVSMGAATVMMTSGETLPDNVKAIVEDCGYTSVWDIFSSEMKVRFGLPDFPLMNVSSMMSSFKAGYDWKEASALEQVKKSRTPMLFIHGDQDDFVPTDMVYPLYEAAAGEKQLLVVKGAGHAKARETDSDLYWRTVRSFLSSYVA